ncbi:aminoglycoside phosphotransferase [Streptomyces sp. NPDC006925]|uniref:aminoglycoside phosphotransferase n=1 Tax=Streptomyces sp. NPDC006925 TaxID=3364768 RepID=UPI0036C399D2
MKLDWHDLPATTRAAVADRTGPIYAASTIDKGLNNALATTLRTSAGHVFVKGMRSDHPRVWTQGREAAINPYVTPLAPRLLWTLDDGTWNLLGYEHLDGQPADYRPGSPDIPLITDAITALSQVRAPADVELKQIEQRLADYTDSPGDAALLRGEAVLHTDWTPDNVLITGRTARIVDWAWPTRGAAWIDAACWTLWLISAGHNPDEAEGWAAKTAGWASAPARGLDVFVRAQQRLWEGIAADAPDLAWKQQLADAATRWAAYRHH